jgi:hypothetical protein
MGVGLDAATITTPRREAGWARPVLVVGAFDAEVAHLALDHPREGAQTAFGQQTLGDLPDAARERPGFRLRGGGRYLTRGGDLAADDP